MDMPSLIWVRWRSKRTGKSLTNVFHIVKKYSAVGKMIVFALQNCLQKTWMMARGTQLLVYGLYLNVKLLIGGQSNGTLSKRGKTSVNLLKVTQQTTHIEMSIHADLPQRWFFLLSLISGLCRMTHELQGHVCESQPWPQNCTGELTH